MIAQRTAAIVAAALMVGAGVLAHPPLRLSEPNALLIRWKAWAGNWHGPTSSTATASIGGRLSEENNAKGVAANSFTAQFAIDWIRVYRCASDPDKGRVCMR